MELLQESFWTKIGQIDGSDVEGLSNGFIDRGVLIDSIVFVEWDKKECLQTTFTENWRWNTTRDSSNSRQN